MEPASRRSAAPWLRISIQPCSVRKISEMEYRFNADVLLCQQVLAGAVLYPTIEAFAVDGDSES